MKVTDRRPLDLREARGCIAVGAGVGVGDEGSPTLPREMDRRRRLVTLASNDMG